MRLVQKVRSYACLQQHSEVKKTLYHQNEKIGAITKPISRQHYLFNGIVQELGAFAVTLFVEV